MAATSKKEKEEDECSPLQRKLTLKLEKGDSTPGLKRRRSQILS